MARSNSEELKGVAIGDLHLDKLVNIIPNINVIIIQFLRKLLRDAVDSGCDVAVLLGDIFNYMNASEESQRLLLGLFVEFKDEPIDIFAIEGNHGYKRNGTGSLSTLAMLEDYKLINTQLITKPRLVVIKNVPLLFMPYPYTSVKSIAKDAALMWDLCVESGLCDANSYEQADSAGADMDGILYESIAFGHFTRSGSTNDNGSATTDGVKYERGADARYYINGHLHTPQILGSHTYYPGTFYQTSFGESTDKGYGLFKAYVDDKGRVHMKYKQVEVESPIKLVNIVASKQSHLPNLDKLESDTWYKIEPLNGFVVPKEYYTHRQIVIRSKPSTKSKQSSSGVSVSESFDLEDSLIGFLKDEGFEDDELRMASKLLKMAKNELGM